MIFTDKHSIVEASSYKLAFSGKDGETVDIVDPRTPLDFAIQAEELAMLSASEREEQLAKNEAISGFLSWLFAPVNSRPASFVEIGMRIFTIAYTIRPDLLDGKSLDDIGKLFGTSRQTMSARVIRQNEKLRLHGRNQKGIVARSVYQAGTEKWHKERIAKERREARRKYLKDYREKNRERINRQHRKYYKRNRKRILDAQRQRRRLRNFNK